MAKVPAMTHARIGGALVVEGPIGASLLGDARDINDVIGECFGAQTTLALLYGENLPAAFFDVSSRQAGEILQKLRNYGLRLAVVLAPGRPVSRRFHELEAAERRDGAFAVFDTRGEALAWLTSTEMTDPFNLNRFVEAQADVYPQALTEIRAGRKRSHWMWFIFPQIAGLGSSPASQHFAINSRAEAQAFLAHPVLGRRLLECSGALLALQSRSATEVFGHPDDLKLMSSMTLFAAVSEPHSVFARILDTFFAGQRDAVTVRLLD